MFIDNYDIEKSITYLRQEKETHKYKYLLYGIDENNIIKLLQPYETALCCLQFAKIKGEK